MGADREQAFRSAGEALVDAWSAADGSDQPSPRDWQLAELSVHTWDLATALGESTAGLDPEVAGQGLAFMRDNLTRQNRGERFASEQEAPSGADRYTRLAAFAGREV